MRFLKWFAVLLVMVMVQTIAGCGGGGGAVTPPTTKTATLKFTSQITNPDDLISGFELTVYLPAGSYISTDTTGAPSSSTVVIAGTGGISDVFYSSSSRKLKVTYAFSNDYSLQNFFGLGAFITILVTAPVSYEPNTSGLVYDFRPFNPSGATMTTVTATPTFY
jgi:predicted small lipoprotein YifL